MKSNTFYSANGKDHNDCLHSFGGWSETYERLKSTAEMTSTAAQWMVYRGRRLCDVNGRRFSTETDDNNRWYAQKHNEMWCPTSRWRMWILLSVAFTIDWDVASVTYNAMLNINIDRRITQALSLIYATMQAGRRRIGRREPLMPCADQSHCTSMMSHAAWMSVCSSSSIASSRPASQRAVMTRNKTAQTLDRILISFHLVYHHSTTAGSVFLSVVWVSSLQVDSCRRQ